MTNIESDYPFILNKLLKYIVKIKETEKEMSIMEIILEYCLRTGVELELIGDVISTDEYLKQAIENDLSKHHFSKAKFVDMDW